MQEARSFTADPRWVRNVQRFVEDAGILNEDVERTVYHAFCAVPRFGFSEGATEKQSCEDIDLPLAPGAWLTRPSILVRMMGLINLRRRMRVLEVGFGSGYLCSVMAAAGAQVFGVEANTSLAQSTRRQLDTLGLHGIVVRKGEGRKGWEDVSPFDAIVVSYPVAGELDLPLNQLSVGGVLVAPLLCDEGTRLAMWRRLDEGTRRVLFEVVEFR
jgi:protein-L-isoaspartate(D-aspartate) O-methyltransferase